MTDRTAEKEEVRAGAAIDWTPILLTVAVVLINLLVDMLYAVLDPRVRRA